MHPKGMVDRLKLVCGSAMIWVALAGGSALGQTGGDGLNTPLPTASGTAPQPANGGLDNATLPGAKDRAAEASPTPATRAGTAVHIGTPVQVKMTAAVDSGSVRNGDTVHGRLAAPLKTTSGVVLPAGTPVLGTVVSAARAGTLQSGGVLSLQLTKVGSLHVVTDVAEFDGQEGHKDVADAAPEKGSEAIVNLGAVLTFNVLENGAVPGLVKGVAPVQSKDQGMGTNAPAAGDTGSPNMTPGVGQHPVSGATQGVVPARPKS